jgi:sirohydrochlorin ferrochelatase
MSRKALIIVDHGSTLEEANEVLALVAGLLKSEERSGFDIIRYCHMELAEPTISQAFDECVAEGANHIVVHPYFLAPGKHSKHDIPKMVGEAASKHRGVSYFVTEPLGVHEKIIDVVLERAGGKHGASD